MKLLLPLLIFVITFFTIMAHATASYSGDLAEIQAAGVLRHIGIPYANFVTGSSDGMDVELIKGFAKYLGVRYEFIKADWATEVEDLIGRKVTKVDGQVVLGEVVNVKGDLIANGFTLIPWREQIMDFSDPTFPSQIWLVAKADLKEKPIKPSKNVQRDIDLVKRTIKGKKILALPNTCLDPRLYNLDFTGATFVNFKGNLNELAPALIFREAEFTLLDAPDALIALEKWPGKIKIIGPMSLPQLMAVGFPKSSPGLRNAFNKYLEESKHNGVYAKLIKKYYPTASYYFPAFFKKIL